MTRTLRRLCTAVLFATFAAHAVASIRILCVGDSITQGGRLDRDEATYRLPLQSMLHRAGVPFDFIGSRRDGVDREARWPAGFDPDHEGYYGATTAAVRDALASHLPGLPPPDVALVLLGANDAPVGFIGPLTSLVRMLRERNAHVVVLIGHVPSHGWRARWHRFWIDRMVRRETSAQSPIVAVSLEKEWRDDPQDPFADTFDGVHPNAKGQEAIARRWFEAMRPFLGLLRGPDAVRGPQPSPTGLAG
jgi:lysophospholipase L1-like esterase